MDTYEDDSELGSENDQSARELKKRRRVSERKEYKKSGWLQELQQKDLSDHTSKAAKRFRGDFRVPYSFCEKLVELVQERARLPTAATDAVGRPCIPVELKNPNPSRFRKENATVEPETAPALRGDGLGPAELDSLKTLISKDKGFGLLSLIRALMFSGGRRDFMLSLMGIALLIGQWAGPIGFIAFKLRSEDVTECPRDGGLWARFLMVSVSMVYFARLSLASLRHKETRPEGFGDYKMPKWWTFYRPLDNVVTSLLYDTFILLSNLLIVFQDRGVNDMVVDVLALEFFTIIDDKFKTALLDYDSDFLFNMEPSALAKEMSGPQRCTGGLRHVAGDPDKKCRDTVQYIACATTLAVISVIRLICRIVGPFCAFMMIFYGPYCLGAPASD